MADIIHDFSSIVLRKPGLIKDSDLIRSFVSVLKNLKTTIDSVHLEYLFKRIVQHIRTYGETPDDVDTADIQLLLEQAYNEFYSIVTDLTPDPDLLSLIRNNTDVVLNKFVHIITDKTLYDKTFSDWRDASVSKGYFSGTDTEFRNYIFKFFKIYDTEMPSGADWYNVAISAKVFIDFFLNAHDTSLDPHDGTLVNFMNTLIPTFTIPMGDTIPTEEPPYLTLKGYEIFHLNLQYDERPDEVKQASVERFTTYVNDNSINPVIDVGRVDKASSLSQTSFAGISAIAKAYKDWYEEEEPETTFIAKDHLFTKDEIEELLLKKDSDYYSNHLNFVVDPDSSQIMQDIVSAERSSVFLHYFKMINLLETVPTEFTLHTKFRLNKIYTSKTKDVINITNYSRSILAIYLQPYLSGGVLRNRLKVALDNFNPSMTYTLLNDIVDDAYNEVELVMRTRKTTIDLFCRVNNVLHLASYPTSMRVYDPTPVSMFLGLFLTHFKKKNNVLSYVNIYNSEISNGSIMNLISGFKES